MTLLRTRWLGRLPYEEAWDLQRAFHEGKVRGRTNDDYLFLLEHPPVFTIGRNGSIDNLLVGAAAGRGERCRSSPHRPWWRYHLSTAPGQLVGYPDHLPRGPETDSSLTCARSKRF